MTAFQQSSLFFRKKTGSINSASGQAPEEEITGRSESKPTTAPENAGPGLNVTVKGGYEVKMTEITVQLSGIKKTLPLARQSHVLPRTSPYYRSPEVYFAKNQPRICSSRRKRRATSTRAHAWSSSRGRAWWSSRSGVENPSRETRTGRAMTLRSNSLPFFSSVRKKKLGDTRSR